MKLYFLFILTLVLLCHYSYANNYEEIDNTLREFNLKNFEYYRAKFQSLEGLLKSYKDPEVFNNIDESKILQIAETIVFDFYSSVDVQEFYVKLAIFSTFQDNEENPEISFTRLQRNIEIVTGEFKKMKSTGVIPDKYKDKIIKFNEESMTLFNMWDKQIFSIGEEANSILRVSLLMVKYREMIRKMYQRERENIFFEFSEDDLRSLEPVLESIVEDYYDTEDMKTQLLKILVIFSIYYLEQSENGDFFFLPLKEQFDKTWESTRTRNMYLVVGAGAASVILVQVTKKYLLKIPIKESLVQKLMLKINGGKPGTISRLMSWFSERKFISSKISPEKFMSIYNKIPLASAHLTDIFLSYWVGDKVGENILKRVGLIKIDKYQNPVSNMPIDKVVTILLMDAES